LSSKRVKRVKSRKNCAAKVAKFPALPNPCKQLYFDFVQRGGAEFNTAGNLLVVEDFKRGTHKDMGPKGVFETADRIV